MTKTDLIFPAFSSRFVDFAVQFCFRFKFSFNKELRNYYNIYSGIQENTGEYKRIECVQCHAIIKKKIKNRALDKANKLRY